MILRVLSKYLVSQVRVAFAREVRQLQQALREAGRRDVVLALKGARHRHAESQQKVRRLEVATGEVRQQLHIAHLIGGGDKMRTIRGMVKSSVFLSMPSAGIMRPRAS